MSSNYGNQATLVVTGTVTLDHLCQRLSIFLQKAFLYLHHVNLGKKEIKSVSVDECSRGQYISHGCWSRIPAPSKARCGVYLPPPRLTVEFTCPLQGSLWSLPTPSKAHCGVYLPPPRLAVEFTYPLQGSLWSLPAPSKAHCGVYLPPPRLTVEFTCPLQGSLWSLPAPSKAHCGVYLPPPRLTVEFTCPLQGSLWSSPAPSKAHCGVYLPPPRLTVEFTCPLQGSLWSLPTLGQTETLAHGEVLHWVASCEMCRSKTTAYDHLLHISRPPV